MVIPPCILRFSLINLCSQYNRQAFGDRSRKRSSSRSAANSISIDYSLDVEWLTGELLLGQIEANWCYYEAETCFGRALEAARRQRTKSWELRATALLDTPG
jgi:hypothetical protein